MARDPFAPVIHQSGPPKWLFIVGGCVAFILIGLGSVMYLVISKRAVAAATPPTPAPVAAPVDPAAAATGQADKPAPAGDAVAANDKPGTAEDKGEKGEKSGGSRRHHSKSSGGSSKKSEPSAAKPAAPAAPPPKPKKAMDQKEIDKLLGI